MANSRSLLLRQIIAGSLVALGLTVALANIGDARTAKADETPPAGWREQRAHLPADEIVGQTWQPPKSTAVGQ